uniref:J domain-containing protein n=1 Tax=Populus davidiana TaxID=266767 RepID=A0A6M2F8I0_9ROSI
MSPAAAVDIRSPVTSKHPSSFQNPNSNPIENNHRHSVKAPVFGSASEIDMNENGSQIGLGRARPRLVKVRRRLHGRNRGAAPGELCGSGSGFNPFKPVSDDSCSSDNYLNGNSNVSNVGFVFGANGSVKSGRLDLDLNSRVELDFKEKEFGGSVGQLREKEPTLDSKMEAGEFGNVGFVFGANGNNVEVKFVSEKRQLNECGVNACEAENEKVRNADDSESYDDRSELGLGLNTNEGDSSGNGVKLGSDDVGSVSDATHDGTCTNMGVSGSGFVFGPSWFDGKLNSNEGQRELGESSGDSAIADTGKMKVRHEAELYKVKGNGKGIFVSPSSSKKSSFLNESVVTKCPVEVKSSGETFLNCSTSMDQNGNLNSSVNDKCTFASFANSSNVASASSMNPIFNLPDDIKKLNINEFQNVHGTDDKNSSAKDDSSFVFRSSKMVSASSNGSSGGDKFETSDKNRSCNTASTSIGISSSGLFTFQAGRAKNSFEAQLSEDQVNDDTQLNGAAAQTSLSSGGFDSQVNNVVSEATTMAGVDKENNESSSTNTLGGLGMPFTDFKTPWDPSCFKTSLFPELNKKLEFTANSRSKKGKRSQMRIRLKQDSLGKQEQEQDHVQNERSDQENLNTPSSYSPMDFSPYEETTAEKFSEETFVTSNDSNHQENNCASSILHSTEIAGLRESGGLDTNKDDGKPREKMNPENSDSGSERCFMGDYISKEFVFGAEMPCSGFNFVQVSSRDAGAAEDKHGLKTESSHQVQFSFASGSGDLDGRKFSFSASSSEQISSSAPKRQFRKKYRRKNPCEPYVVTPNPNGQEEDLSTPQRKVGNKSEINELAQQGSISSTDSVQEACEMWRARGNRAYQNGDMSKAEDFYTSGINSIPSSEMSGCCLKPLVICYSNRAATRMSLGNMREALRDCIKASGLDPNFLKVQMRAANCHLQLGEVEDALHYFSKCLESGAGVCLDRRTTIEAADGLQKAQKVAECTNRSAKLLEERTYDAAVKALDAIGEALSISPYSERLLEMKAEFLFMLQKYKEVIQLCEQTLSAAEKHFASIGADGQFVDTGCSESENCSFARVWRWHLISKSNFYLGKLEVALDLLEKLEQMGSISYKYANANRILESSVTLAVTVRDLLRHKSAGNEAVRSGRYAEAVEHYTAALSNNIESRPFSAICFGNRAAAHQALGQIADAISDCSLAVALDGNYSKAVARRAALHERIRDYGQAASDLQRLISILENQSDGKVRQSSKPARSTSWTKELRQARQRLSLMEEEAKKGIHLDLYCILGVKDSETASDIKKAYHKAALKHHPDKAGQFLARSGSGDDGRLWKEIVQEVHADADRLFKMIGEAYAVLSDPTKRSEYDLDEQIRRASKENNGSSPHGRTSYTRGNSNERNEYRRNWQDNWKTYGYSRSRW